MAHTVDQAHRALASITPETAARLALVGALFHLECIACGWLQSAASNLASARHFSALASSLVEGGAS